MRKHISRAYSVTTACISEKVISYATSYVKSLLKNGAFLPVCIAAKRGRSPIENKNSDKVA